VISEVRNHGHQPPRLLSACVYVHSSDLCQAEASPPARPGHCSVALASLTRDLTAGPDDLKGLPQPKRSYNPTVPHPRLPQESPLVPGRLEPSGPGPGGAGCTARAGHGRRQEASSPLLRFLRQRNRL